MNRVVLGVQPSKNMVQSDLEKFRSKSQSYVPQLVKWTNEEVPLLCYNYESLARRRGISRSDEGFFKSKFQEVMFYFAQKEYLATSKKVIIYSRTHEDEIIFQIKKDSAQVYLNSNYTGDIAKSGEFYNTNTETYFGKIERIDTHHTRVFDAEGDLLGTVLAPSDWDAISPPATDMEKELDDKEMLVFKIFCIYEMILVFNEKNKQGK